MDSRFLKLALAAIFVLVLWASAASGANYYVAATGSDSANGSQATPWQTLTKVNSSMGSFAAGDTVNFNGGDTFSGTLTIGNGLAGTSINPITFQSYGTGQATISGGASAAVTAGNSNGYKLNNLTITSSTPNSSGVGGPRATVAITITSATGTRYTGVSITNCAISGGECGVNVVSPNTTTDGLNGLTVTGNTITAATEFGVYLCESGFGGLATHYSNAYIGSNNVNGITGDSVAGTASGVGIVLGNSDSGTIEHNLVYNCGASGTQASGPGGIFPIYATNVVIQYNHVHHIHTAGGDGIGLDLDASTSNCTVQYNYTHECDGAGILYFSGGTANVIRFNLSVNDAQTKDASVMVLAAGALDFYQNTIVRYLENLPTTAACINDTNPASNHRYFNNLLHARGSVLVTTSGTGAIFEGNAYLRTVGFLAEINATNYTTLAAWTTAAGTETINGGNANFPFFAQPTVVPSPADASTGSLATITSYQMRGGSPLFSSALDLSARYSIGNGGKDFLGNSIGNSNLAVGAFQTSGSPAVSAYELLTASNGPPLYWGRLGEASGTSCIDQMGSIAGTYSNVTLAQSGAIPTTVDTAASFNGSTSGMESTHILVNAANPTVMTIRMWIKPSTVSGQQFLFGEWSNTASDEHFGVFLVGSELQYAIDQSGSFLVAITSGAGIQAGVWQQVTAVWSGGNTVHLYVNGVEPTTNHPNTSSISSITGATDIYIGRYRIGGTGSAFYNGVADEVVWYQTALSGTAVLADYTAGIKKIPSGNNHIGIDLGIGISSAANSDVWGKVGFDPFAQQNRVWRNFRTIPRNTTTRSGLKTTRAVTN